MEVAASPLARTDPYSRRAFQTRCCLAAVAALAATRSSSEASTRIMPRRCSKDTPDEGAHQTQSGAVRRHQASSDAIRDAIRRNRTPWLEGKTSALRKSTALRRNLMAIGRNHTFGLEEVDGTQTHSVAIGRNHTFGLEEVDGRLHGDR